MSYQNNFSTNIKLFRIASGMTMDELSKKSGISIQQIGKYETRVTEPKLRTLLVLAETFGISVSHLISASLKLEVKEEIVFESSINPQKK